jgi:hypothetical protein
MAAAVQTISKPSDVQDFVIGNKRARIRDITTDTGTYATGGSTIQASSFGLKHIDAVIVCSVSTSGTAGATALPVGIIYGTGGTSITLQYYESGGANAINAEKTNAEAMPSNQTVRVIVIGV